MYDLFSAIYDQIMINLAMKPGGALFSPFFSLQLGGSRMSRMIHFIFSFVFTRCSSRMNQADTQLNRLYDL